MLDSRDRWVSSALWECDGAPAKGTRGEKAYGAYPATLDEIAYLEPNAYKNKSPVSRKLRAHNTYDGWPRAQEDTHNAHREQM